MEENIELRVAGYQMGVGRDVQCNKAAICQAVRQAAEAGAEILLTPEGSLSGYTPHFDPAEVSGALAEVTGLARECGLGLALGTCFREADGLVYNQLRFYDRAGVFLGFHAKTLRCGSLTEPPIGEINDYAAAPLRLFDFHGLPIGGLICNDLWANPGCTPQPDPHLTQQLVRLGARVIFHAVNGGRDGSSWSTGVVWNFHEANLRMRAQAGQVWIVTIDNAALEGAADPFSAPCSAPGGVVDPRGQWAVQTNPVGEHIFVYTIIL